MSSGACRALAALLLTLVATIGMTLPVAAEEPRLRESSDVVYTINPRNGIIDVAIGVDVQSASNNNVTDGTLGPFVTQERVDRVDVRGRGFAEAQGAGRTLPGAWTAIDVSHPRIDDQGAGFSVEYRVRARTDQDKTALEQTVGRVDQGYIYVCVPGQDSDVGQTTIRISGGVPFEIDQSGTILRQNPQGDLVSDASSSPTSLFTCIEATRTDRLTTAEFPGPDGRQIILQGWPGPSNDGWLLAVESNGEPALDRIRDFLELEIPGEEPVVIREAPNREIGGYASDHDTPGIVQVDERGGVDDPDRGLAPEHEFAHAWFGTDNIRDLWLREGLAEWTASSIRGAACEPVDDNINAVELQDWKVVQPTSDPDTIAQQISDQEAAACGIVRAMADRMSEEQFREVLGAMLRRETTYNGSSGPEPASDPVVDYREWLDAVDERGLVPARMSDAGDGATVAELDLDYAQDLLEAFGVEVESAELDARSAARARYHQFLIDAKPLGAPLAVRDAMDRWEFASAMRALDKSDEVLGRLREADALLPTAGLIPFLRPAFEGAQDDEALDDVLNQTLIVLDEASGVSEPLRALLAASPEGWELPVAIVRAIPELRFDDITAAIAPSLEIVQDVSAADQSLPQARFLDTYKTRYEATTSTAALNELATEVSEVRGVAERTAAALSDLNASVGEWQIPAAVTDPIENGQIAAGLAIVNDARAVVKSASDADFALRQSGIGAAVRERFESVSSSGEMSVLRTETELVSQQAQSVGNALADLGRLAPDWQIPSVIQKPVNDRDFEAAAAAAEIAQDWITDVGEANEKLPAMNALERAREEFESAATLADLEVGAARASNWNIAAVQVAQAQDAYTRPRDLLEDVGLWGVDLQPRLEESVTAAVEGESELAIRNAIFVIDSVRNASSSGGLRLAGVVFLGVAILGVLGLWLILRREAGPPWARQTKPHWVDDKKGPRLLGRGKKQDKNDKNKKP